MMVMVTSLGDDAKANTSESSNNILLFKAFLQPPGPMCLCSVFNAKTLTVGLLQLIFF